MGEDVAVREARAEDVEPWLTLFESVAAEGRWIGTEAPVDREARRAIFEALIGVPDALVVVAEASGGIVGVLNGRLRRGVVDVGMVVAEGWRGRGVGSLLMERCVAWAAAEGAHKVVLEVWPHNERAIALYRKFGFEVEGRLRRHYRRRNGELWDALQMGLVLDHDAPGSPSF